MTNLTRFACALVVAGFISGCGETVDTSGLPDISDYQTWRRYDVTGDIPGHLDTYRIIYVNETAQTYTGAGRYPLGSVIVKEIRDGGENSELKYIAVMRQLAEGEVDAELDNGWLFTDLRDGINGDELHGKTCWKNCHAQAPYAGAWFDYGAQ